MFKKDIRITPKLTRAATAQEVEEVNSRVEGTGALVRSRSGVTRLYTGPDPVWLKMCEHLYEISLFLPFEKGWELEGSG